MLSVHGVAKLTLGCALALIDALQPFAVVLAVQ